MFNLLSVICQMTDLVSFCMKKTRISAANMILAGTEMDLKIIMIRALSFKERSCYLEPLFIGCLATVHSCSCLSSFIISIFAVQ